jgi:hypothetical protein
MDSFCLRIVEVDPDWLSTLTGTHPGSSAASSEGTDEFGNVSDPLLFAFFTLFFLRFTST